MISGVINVYKEAGMTSFQVVYQIRKLTGEKKIGHTGTLDPDATGVLPVCIGKATKLVDSLMDSDKQYMDKNKDQEDFWLLYYICSTEVKISAPQWLQLYLEPLPFPSLDYRTHKMCI